MARIRQTRHLWAALVVIILWRHLEAKAENGADGSVSQKFPVMALTTSSNDLTLLKQGAEARLYTGTFLGRPVVIKERFKKAYRHPSLEKSLTSQRTKSEVRSMLRCRANGIATPVIYFVDEVNNKIYMEHLTDSQTVRDYIRSIQQNPDSDLDSLYKTLGKKIGEAIGKMHEKNIIHGDLTTSNMLLRSNGLELVMIDFGLGYIDNVAEDKGVDLYVLERALLSTHPNTEQLFVSILDTYKKFNSSGSSDVIKKLEEVRLRGRKRTMVG